MGTEIERKFLVRDDSWRELSSPGTRLRQGYLVSEPPVTVRVRLSENAAWLTLKGPVIGISRAEYEYSIPLADGEELLALRIIDSVIEKTRYRIPHDGLVIELDEFHGANAGLFVAEVELPSETTPFSTPAWLGPEVTQDFRYHNSHLAKHSWSEWDGES